MKFFFYLLLVPQIILAEGPEMAISTVDMKESLEEGGSWLIYNCEGKNWGCVARDAFQECGEIQKREDFLGEAETFSCVPIGEMASKRSCEQRLLFLTTQNYGARFCIKDQWKNKAIDF